MKYYQDIASEAINELIEENDYCKKEYENDYFKVIKVKMLEGNKYKYTKGKYYSLFYDDLLDEEAYIQIKRELVTLLEELLDKEFRNVLIVGIGNEDFAPDSLGPRVIKKIKATYHLSNEYKTKVACIIPGVMGVTGLESASIVKGIIQENRIDAVIVIDSLATNSIDRLNHVIQITDTGIRPGSGVSNYRKGLNEKYLGCKVISIGIGTVISFQSIVNEFSNKKVKKKYENIIFTTKEIEIKIEIMTDLLASSINELLNPNLA